MPTHDRQENLPRLLVIETPVDLSERSQPREVLVFHPDNPVTGKELRPKRRPVRFDAYHDYPFVVR